MGGWNSCLSQEYSMVNSVKQPEKQQDYTKLKERFFLRAVFPKKNNQINNRLKRIDTCDIFSSSVKTMQVVILKKNEDKLLHTEYCLWYRSHQSFI